MFKILKESLDLGGRTLTLETGRVARQADGAVIATYGETSVLCTVMSFKEIKQEPSFLPLTVHYIERTSAAGRIPGSFFKREGRPSEREILISRLIDRPLRPLFPKRFLNETGIVCTLLSHDLETDSDIVAMIGASAAVTLAGIPLTETVAAVKVGYHEGRFILNPTSKQLKVSSLDLTIAGTQEGILTVELGANKVPDQVIFDALSFGHESLKGVILALHKLRERANVECKPNINREYNNKVVDDQIIYLAAQEVAEVKLKLAYELEEKSNRDQAVADVYRETILALQSKLGLQEDRTKSEVQVLEKKILRQRILESRVRIDGREARTIRPIECEVGWIPRVHGSALFTRGETQAIVTTTLGTAQDEQIIDALDEERRERFLLHYNFPSYAVGEISRTTQVTRREVGHGRLAWKAIHSVLPQQEIFPYTIRVVSDITESNGSSSMATVCGASLSLMDAGVPVEHPSAGIAMGLITGKSDGDFVILSDISGDEDHIGDMDLKVAGTTESITALQLDVKTASVRHAILQEALLQAKDGLLEILEHMKRSIQKPRKNVSNYAPHIRVAVLPKEKVRHVIGPGGKVIRDICDQTKTRISIDDGGTASIAGADEKSVELALEKVQAITAEPTIGSVYSGTVQRIMEFGVIVNFLGNRTGLVHVSQMSSAQASRIGDAFTVGDQVSVKLIGMNEQGKFRLSCKKVSQ